MKKLIISGGIAVITIPCLCYYVTKYYIYRTLTFEQSMMVMFIIISTLMAIGLLIGFYNAYQNVKLHNRIDELENKIEQCHYDNIEYHEDNRELLLDLDKGDR